jgi:hypothetical protein
MIELTVYNTGGQQVDTVQIDESVLGGCIRYSLLKQAIVMYHAKRVGTATTKSRSFVAGSTRKLYRQKGTGNARVGTRRTGKRVGGGMTFAKEARDFSQRMPRKQRLLARDSAVLAKLRANHVVVVRSGVRETPDEGFRGHTEEPQDRTQLPGGDQRLRRECPQIGPQHPESGCDAGGGAERRGHHQPPASAVYERRPDVVPGSNERGRPGECDRLTEAAFAQRY